MKLSAVKPVPILLAALVTGAFCVLQQLHFDLFERMENMTYDWRVRQAANFSPPVATNLGFVNITDDTIADVNGGLLGASYGLYWPRHIYGRVARELSLQGAKAVAFDVLFGELRPDHAPIQLEGERLVESDDYFADQMRRSGNVIIAAEQGIIPPPQFRSNAAAVGDITAERDADGVLRRALAFRVYKHWHQAFRTVEDDPDFKVDLSQARVEPGRVVLPRGKDLDPIYIPLDTNGDFDLRDFVGDHIPPGMARFDKPFVEERVWHMGIVLAAQELKLDLPNANVDLPAGRITLVGTNGVTRVIPVDQRGYFYINWVLPVNDVRQRLTQEPFEALLAQYQMSLPGKSNALAALLASRWQTNVDWRGKLVVVGSAAIGNDLTDRGATPLAKDTFLVSKHWNVANSVITGQFIQRSSQVMNLLLIVLMGALAAGLTWIFRSFVASLWVAGAFVAYAFAAWFVFLHYRYWMPTVLPLGGGLCGTHVALMVYLVFFEQKEKRRFRSVLVKMVSADVAAELLKTEKLSLSGARRNVTIFFADIRGFTEMTDLNMEKAAEYVKEQKLTGDAAEAVFDTQSRETLATVNLYLKVIAETVLRHNGTVDKFIGDCVMAFWGAPIANARHALACVRAAIDSQRAVQRLNDEREAENKLREQENLRLALAGQPLRPLLPVLSVGSGINTGVVTVGLMGSDDRLNYTVFGRDVNLAQRLESYSGRGRIIISESTLAEIIQDDAALALSCQALPAVNLKGFRTAIPVYEVPWRESANPAATLSPAAVPTAATGQDSHDASFVPGGP